MDFKNEVPEHIKLSEFKKMMELIDNEESPYTLREKVIISLMYKRGLRIGEVMGLTIEDILQNPDDPNSGLLVLRNRVSDKKHQHAKGAMKVFSRDDYNTEAYKRCDVGFETIALPPEMYELLREYIYESRDQFNMTDKAWENMKNKCKADSVFGDEIENYYTFTSKNYTPISKTGWNRIVKSIFQDIGIILDKNKKRENLNHRFRHGYAMFLLYEMKYPDWMVQKELRHKSIATLSIYHTPTKEQKLEGSIKIENKIYRMFNDKD